MNARRTTAILGVLLMLTSACAQPQPDTTAQDTQNFMNFSRAMNPDMVMERVLIPPNDIPAFYVYMKAKENDVKPAVILVHGHNTDKRFLFSLNWPRDLAYMGYAVLAIDAWGHGERESKHERLTVEAQNWFDAATKAIQETIHDIPAVYDYLAAQPNVDPKRIGLTGTSMGGCITIGAAVVEDRIAAFVPVSAGCDYMSWFAESTVFPGGDQLPDHVKARIKEFDPIYFPERIAGKPVRFIHGLNDALLPPKYAKGLYESLHDLYNNCPGRLDWKGHDVYPVPKDRAPESREVVVTHHVSPGMSQDVFDWLEAYVRTPPESPCNK